MANNIRYLSIVAPADATGELAGIYRQAKKEVGRLPEPVTMFSPSPRLGAAAWAAFREPLLVSGHAARVAKEAVAAVVSRQNQCPFCVDAHTIMLYGGGSGAFATQLLDAVPADQLDSALRPYAQWAEACALEAGVPRSAPFTAEQAPEFLAVFVYFHFLNRMLNVLVPQTFLPGPQRAHRVARKVAGRVLSKNVKAVNTAGKAVGLPDERPLPEDLGWASGGALIARSIAGLAAEADRAGVAAVPEPAREVVLDALNRWDGTARPLGTDWLRDLLEPLTASARPAARLALLTAFASYRVTERDVQAYRDQYSTDSDLLGLLAWSSFGAARRIGAWSASGLKEL
jgi:AhpD family alkylhydroperoxidase